MLIYNKSIGRPIYPGWSEPPKRSDGPPVWLLMFNDWYVSGRPRPSACPSLSTLDEVPDQAAPRLYSIAW